MKDGVVLVFVLVFFLVGSLFFGCVSLDPDSLASFRQDRSDPPLWYTSPPLSEEYIYAVGWSGPTYKPSKSRTQALTRAVKTLASQAATYIKNETFMHQDLNRSRVDSFTESEIEGKIEGFTIVAERPIFDDGNNRSAPGTTYILIRIPKTQLTLR